MFKMIVKSCDITPLVSRALTFDKQTKCNKNVQSCYHCQELRLNVRVWLYLNYKC